MRFLLLICILPSLQAVCIINSCTRWLSKAKTFDLFHLNAVDNACAIVFEENCCKVSNKLLGLGSKAKKYHIPKNTEGYLCSFYQKPRSTMLADILPTAATPGCKGATGLKNDIESMIIRPGCTVEVWTDASGLDEAKAEERLGAQQGSAKHDRDIQQQKKGYFVNTGTEDIIFEDLGYTSDGYRYLNNDIEAFRCKCS